MIAADRDRTETMLCNGTIYTMNPKLPWAQAILIRDGRIAAIGSEVDVRQASSGDARETDLGGRMVMPGIIDVHNHAVWAGREELHETRFWPTLTLEQILAEVRTAAARLPADAWIIGSSWGSGLLAEFTVAARRALDDAAGGRPVMLRDDSHHNRWINTAALRLAGIETKTPNPVNGEIVRDAETGEATGVLLETACAAVEAAVAKVRAASPQLDVDAGAHALARLNAYGVTGFQDSLSTRPVLEALKRLDDSGRLSAWVVASMPLFSLPFESGEVGNALLALREQYRGPHLRPDAAKIMLDGVPPSRTSAMLEPYLPDAVHGRCYCGSTLLTVPQVARALADCEKRGIRVKIHCAGDGAVRAALDAIDVLRSFNGPGLMHHIAHASFIAESDVPRFAELNVAADLSPIIWFPSVIVEAIRAAVPRERVERFWPNRDLHESGALIAGGSDWPVVPDPDPWQGIEGMVTRRNPSGEFEGALWPEQALDLATVLKAYTINPARAMGIADVTGSLEIGKSADLIVLDRHLFDTPIDELADTCVLATYFEGRVVYERA
jgi:predicted amidohydrolase YtcJ